MKTRKTFGIINPKTGKRYNDIVKHFLVTRNISLYDSNRGFVTCNENEIYRLHLDTSLKTFLKEKQECKCIISFQLRIHKREEQRIALARIYKKEKENGN